MYYPIPVTSCINQQTNFILLSYGRRNGREKQQKRELIHHTISEIDTKVKPNKELKREQYNEERM